MTRRSALIAAGVCLVLPQSAASTLSIVRELRRMVGFQIVAADDVRQAWSDRGGTRFIELRQRGLFRQVGGAIGVDPPGFADAIVFGKPRTRDYRLLIEGEFYQVVAHE